MMYIRPATKYKHQNLVMYQQGEQIYFVSTKSIAPAQELRVWYASHYASRHHKQLLGTAEGRLLPGFIA